MPLLCILSYFFFLMVAPFPVSLMHEGVAFSLATNFGQAEYAFSLTSHYSVFVKINTRLHQIFLRLFIPVLHLYVPLYPKRFLSIGFSNFNISSVIFTTLAPIRGTG